MASLLADPIIDKINIITIQKPYHQKRIIATYCSWSFNFWPAYLEKEHTRACFLINKRIPAYCWNVIFLTENLAVLIVQLKEKRVNMINIYFSSSVSYTQTNKDSLIYQLEKALSLPEEYIIVENLNLHYKSWKRDWISKKY